jgi:hypothetical protein
VRYERLGREAGVQSAWKYTDPATKKKAEAHFGTPLPAYDQLKLTTFNSLTTLTEWIKTYNGASYFDLNDLNIDNNNATDNGASLISRAKD